jgi:hypothetical protein
MRNMTVRRGVVAGLGAAAGALAAAAFVSTAPIASADPTTDATNSIDYTALAAPAVTYPDFTYSNTFDLYNGTNSYEQYVTTYDGTGSPTTVMTAETLPVGETGSGYTDSFADFYNTSATAGTEFSGMSDALDITSATGTSDYFIPLYDVFSSFS